MAAPGHGIQTTGGFSYLLSKDYDRIFFDSFMKTKPQYTQFCKTQNMTGNYWKEAELSGLGQAGLIEEGAPLMFDYPVQGNSKSVVPDKMGLGFQITEEMHDDDQSGNMRKMPAELGNSLRWANEVLWWSLLNDGDDTHLCADGGYIFATTHKTLKSQETWANKPASNGSLSLTTYEALLEHFMTLKNAAGAPIEFNPTTLIIPYNLIWKARELQLSELKPGTSDNDINPVNVQSHSGMGYFVSRYLTSTTAFFGLCAGQHDLRWIVRRKVAFKSGDDFRTGNAMFKATERVKAACWQPRGVYMNPGA